MWHIFSSNIKANDLFDILKNIFCKFGELLRFATPATQTIFIKLFDFYVEWERLYEPVYILFVYLKLWKLILYLIELEFIVCKKFNYYIFDMKPLKIYRIFQHRTSNIFNNNSSSHSCNEKYAALYPTQHIDLTLLLCLPETN